MPRPSTRQFNEARARLRSLKAEYDRLENGDEYDGDIEARMSALVEEMRGFRKVVDAYRQDWWMKQQW